MYRRYFSLLAVLILYSARGLGEDVEKLQVGVNANISLVYAGVIRAAIGNQKIARVRAFPPATLLVTGMRTGKTTLRAWDEAGSERAFEIEVVASELFDPDGQSAESETVKVSLEFLELNSAVGQSLGIRWPEAIQFSGTGSLQTDSLTTGLNHTLGFGSARGLLSHLVREGWAKVLAHPDLYVRLGEEASFHSGGEFPVPTTSEGFGRLQKHIEWKSFGMNVRVRPQSGDRIHLRSEIHLDISEINAAKAIDGIPALSRRKLETKINSEDGETVILSGLVRQAESQEKESVPFLGTLPVVGPFFFSHKNESKEETEVLMAVTLSFSTKSRMRENQRRFRARFQSAEAP